MRDDRRRETPPLPAEGRRRLLRAAAGLPVGLASAWLAQGCAPESQPGEVEPPGTPRIVSPDGTQILVPKANGAINLHSLRCFGCGDETIDPRLVAIQLQAVYELGFDGIRIPAPFGDKYTFLSTVAYVRAARALGIDALVLLMDFSGLTLARALADERRRELVLQMYADVFAPAPPPVVPGMGSGGPKGTGRIAFQILNEPAAFLGLPPDVYVRELLTPCYVALKQIDKSIIVVSAAEVGVGPGPARMRAMLEAGLERTTDRIAYHVYDRDLIPLLPADVRAVVWVTESGADRTSLHLPWVREAFPEIRAHMPDVTRIFFYDLFDMDAGRYRVLAIEPDGDGFRTSVESKALYDHWKENVATIAAGRPLLPFETLVPEMQPYLPTQADVDAFDAAFNS